MISGERCLEKDVRINMAGKRCQKKEGKRKMSGEQCREKDVRRKMSGEGRGCDRCWPRLNKGRNIG